LAGCQPGRDRLRPGAEARAGEGADSRQPRPPARPRRRRGECEGQDRREGRARRTGGGHRLPGRRAHRQVGSTIMPLRVYNTLTRQKEDFWKTPPAKVGMYVCGPTVYKPSHVGHMVGPVIFDTVKRYLTYLGFEVTWVVNITDVDDKLIKHAAELNTTVPALAEKMTADYLDCLKKLNVTGIDKFPKATEHL